MRSPTLICLLLAGSALGLDLKPSLAPTKPAAPATPARPVAPAPVAPVPVAKKETAKAETAKESEPAAVALAKFANEASVRADYQGIQVLLAGFVARGSREFLEVKLAGA